MNSEKHWKYCDYDIYLMTDAGGYWYEIDYNGEWIADVDTYKEAQWLIDERSVA